MTSVLFFLLFTSFPTPASHTRAQEHLCSFILLPQPSFPVLTGGRHVTWYPRVSHYFFHSRQLEMVTHTGLKALHHLPKSHLFKAIAEEWQIKAGRCPWIWVPPLASINTRWTQHSTRQLPAIFQVTCSALLSQSIDESWSDGCNNSCQF